MTNDQARQQAREFLAKVQNDRSISSDFNAILNYLPNSEYQLIQFMSTPPNDVWQGPVPPQPSYVTIGAGSIELGLFLYWIKNPNLVSLSQFSIKDQLIILGIILGLQELLPASLMTADNYKYLQDNELIYNDGSVLSTEQYATFDQNWFIAFLNLAQTASNNAWYNGGIFPTTPAPPVINLQGSQPDTVSIAVIGDWGSGSTAAQQLMKQVTGLNPDYILHVGDVYYAGTPLATDPNGGIYFSPGEEMANLYNLWPAAYAGKSFTLNSNHEMYSGANGFFTDALGVTNSTPKGSGLFSAQGGSTCFLLQFGGWSLLGLDSAFMSSLTSAFMTGSIGGVYGTQGQWIQGLVNNNTITPDTTIVFSHHNGFADDTTSASPLWGEIRGSLGADPYAWYWGHVHNGIVYNSPINIPSVPGQQGITTNTWARCLGHAALPYGLSSNLSGKPGIAWNANTPQPAPSKQLYNGFAVLTLSTASGSMVITENFYDLGGPNPTWTQQIYPAS